ncbi:MAG: trypsin-like peptidase domain-containing protein [bacterium]|nr:trypsin-like peptidase domain-containing protein [bacterium]
MNINNDEFSKIEGFDSIEREPNPSVSEFDAASQAANTDTVSDDGFPASETHKADSHLPDDTSLDEADVSQFSEQATDYTDVVSELPPEIDSDPTPYKFFPSGSYSVDPTPEPAEKKSTKSKTSRPKNNRRPATSVVACILIAVIMGVGSGVASSYFFTKTLLPQNNTSPSTPSETPVTTPQSGANTTIVVKDEDLSVVEAVYQKCYNSVVGIRTTDSVKNFFGTQSETKGEGSGIIYSADGYIVTNFHVIASSANTSVPAENIEVFLPSDTSKGISATVVGYNVSSDLAVIKINQTGLSPIELGTSVSPKVGQFVIAIGNPGGLEFMSSVTYGIISGLNRTVQLDSIGTMKLIQTDAAINPGNSGGALVNTSGQLVGINSSKLINESYEGMGFAIPVSKAVEIINKLIAKEYQPLPYIGVEISSTYDAATLKWLGYPTGAVVSSVASGSPAEKAGIKKTDIITEFNSATVDSYTTFNDLVSDCSPGDKVSIKVYRSGRFYSTTITVGSNNSQ